MESQNVATVTASGETISDIQDYLASFNKEIQDNSSQEVPNATSGDDSAVPTSQATAAASGDESDTTYYVAEGSQISTFQSFGQTQGHFVEGTFYPQYYSSQNQQEYTTLSTFTEGAATGERSGSDALLQAGVTLVSAASNSEATTIPTTSSDGVQQVAVTLSNAAGQPGLQQIVLAATTETQETSDGEATEISVTIPASLASQAGAEELLQAVEAEGGEAQQPTYVAMQPTSGQAQTIRMVVQSSEQDLATANASGTTLVTTDGQEIQVNEDNTLQMVASLAEQASQSSVDANNQVILNTGSAFQTVTIVPSDTSPGEVSYVLIVSQPEEGKEDEDTKNVNMDMSVYDFNEGEQHVPAPEGEEPIVPKARIVKISPKKSQAVSQAHMCNYCNYTSPKRYLLSRHMKSHSEERPHKCSVCERGFKTLASLQNHVNTHTGTRPHQCKECDSAFTTSGELVRHVRYKHTHEKPHKCTECDYASVELSKLKRHMRCHTGERPYQCPHCTYASPDTYKLKRHLRIHTGEKPYECDVCHARFTQSNSLKAHKLIHSGNKPIFQCELCPTTCGRKTDLRIHVQKLHTSDKPLKCKRCGKSFPDRYTYKVHVKTHEGEKCFKCDLCTYASISQRHLESHMLIHTDQKPYQCDQCDQAFRQKQLLKRHKNLYHDPDYVPPVPKEKTHECPECGRAFRHKGNLIRHMAIHDPDASAQEKAAAMRLNRRREKHIGTNGEEVTEDESEEELDEDDPELMDGQEGITLQANQMTTSEGQQVVVLEVIQLQGPEGEQQAVAVVAGDGMDMGPSLQAALGDDQTAKPIKRGRGRPSSGNRTSQEMLTTDNEVKVTPVNALVIKRGRGRPRRTPLSSGHIQILDQVLEDKGNESDQDQADVANDNETTMGRSLRIRKRRYEDDSMEYSPVKRVSRGGRAGNSIRGRPRVRVSDAVTNTSPDDDMDTTLPDEKEIERREAEAVKRRLEQKQKDMDECFGFKEEDDEDDDDSVHAMSLQNDSGTSAETAMQLLAAMQHDESTLPQ